MTVREDSGGTVHGKEYDNSSPFKDQKYQIMVLDIGLLAIEFVELNLQAVASLFVCCAILLNFLLVFIRWRLGEFERSSDASGWIGMTSGKGGDSFSRIGKLFDANGRLVVGFVIGYAAVSHALYTRGRWTGGMMIQQGVSDSAVSRYCTTTVAFSLSAGRLASVMADVRGRRLFSLVCAASGFFSVLSSFFAMSFSGRLIGEVLGAISFGLFFSVPESWLIAELGAQKVSPPTLRRIMSFKTAVSACFGILVALMSTLFFGDGWESIIISPVLFLLFFVIVFFFWKNENYGDRSRGILSTLWEAMKLIGLERRLFLLALTQGVFSVGFYLQVFFLRNWLEGYLREEVPWFSLVLSLLLCRLIGVSLFSIVTSPSLSLWIHGPLSVGQVSVAVFPFLAVCYIVAGFTCEMYIKTPLFLCLCLSEVCAGVYSPAIASIRAVLVPDRVRASAAALMHAATLFALSLMIYWDYFASFFLLGLGALASTWLSARAIRGVDFATAQIRGSSHFS